MKLPSRVAMALDVAAAAHNVTRADILGPRQFFHFVAARREAAQTLRRMGFSLAQIGFYLNRHHTTILYAVNETVGESKAKEIPCPDLSGEWAI